MVHIKPERLSKGVYRKLYLKNVDPYKILKKTAQMLMLLICQKI